MQANIPSLYDWIGGNESLNLLIDRFYRKVLLDPLLEPLFARMPKEHFRHVAEFIAEVFGGPTDYTALRGGHSAMIKKHLGRGITEQQRRQWITLLLDTADELAVPADPEFRSALVAYLEWGSRLAVINSALPSQTDVSDSAMPSWDWGVPGGPFISDKSEP